MPPRIDLLRFDFFEFFKPSCLVDAEFGVVEWLGIGHLVGIASRETGGVRAEDCKGLGWKTKR
jgi:hypothetical protein